MIMPLQVQPLDEQVKYIFSCFAYLPQSNEIVWFDEFGQPVEVVLEGQALVRGSLLLDLPPQPVEVIDEVEAFEQLLSHPVAHLSSAHSQPLVANNALAARNGLLSGFSPFLAPANWPRLLAGGWLTHSPSAFAPQPLNFFTSTSAAARHRRMMNVLLAVLVVGALWAGYGIASGTFEARARAAASTSESNLAGEPAVRAQAFNSAGGGVMVAGSFGSSAGGNNGVAVATIAAAAKGTPQSYQPIGLPTISQAVFTAYLKELSSPALPEAEGMYRAAVEEGGDPAVALAFFEHESSGGRAGVAVLTHSIGNIRCTAGYNCVTTSNNGSFRSYASWTDGARDWVRLLKSYKSSSWHASTLEEIIPHYAPQADHNNEAAYIAGVKATVDRPQKSQLSEPSSGMADIELQLQLCQEKAKLT